MSLAEHHTEDDLLEVIRSPDFSRQLESLRHVALIVGAGAVEQHEIDWARDVIALLLALKKFDKGLQ